MLKLIPCAIIGVVMLKAVADYFQAYFMSYVGLSVIRNIRTSFIPTFRSSPSLFSAKLRPGP
jgi:hypothetical protein